MKKQVRKYISKLIPKGNIKEIVKWHYYNFMSPKNTSFELIKGIDNKFIYKTTIQDLSINTNEPLYFVVPDFKYYQHFYKVKNKDVVIDAGSNCGHLSILFSKIIGKEGIVYAFEPDQFNILKINNNIILNNDLSKNIIIESLLLWNENKLIDFYESGTVGSSAVWIPDKDKCVKKESIRIDDWVFNNNIEKLNFIKMDIEGAEIEALEGCVQTLRNLSPNFAIASYHIVNGEPTYIQVEEFFKKHNYPFKTVHFNKKEIITFAGSSINN